MNIDGSDKRQLTRLGAMSWAPFYHPSGQYLIFTTNRHGFANFELYMIDVDGKSPPVRVTYTKGFDGLPAFTPDGKQLAWTSNRTASGQSQLFLADWNHDHARKLLGLNAVALNGVDLTASSEQAVAANDEESYAEDAKAFAESAHKRAAPGYRADDIGRHVKYLCRDELEGRFTGSRGERLATAYVAAYMERLGLKPAGDDGGWFQPFEFTSGVALGPGNEITVGGKSYEVDKVWRPLSFSGTGKFEKSPLVFAGYGIVADAAKEQEAYDSYAHLDIKDKWVVVFRYLPEEISPEKRQQLSRSSQLRFKTTFAREHGARGLIVVTGPNAESRSELVPLQMDGILAGSSLPVISVTNAVADSWLAASGKSLKQLQDELDNGAPSMGFNIEGVELAAEIDILRIKTSGRNVLARFPAADVPSEQTIVIGAHIDHLGKGASSASLRATTKQSRFITAPTTTLQAWPRCSKSPSISLTNATRDVCACDAIFCSQPGRARNSDSWGQTISSRGWVKATVQQTAMLSSPQKAGDGKSIYPTIAACLNMDMVGRLDKHLILQGVGSSNFWRGEIERRNVPVGLPLTLQDDSYLPTDASSFYMRGVPILSAFTGAIVNTIRRAIRPTGSTTTAPHR